MDEQYKKRLNDAIELFDFGQKAYKAVQNIISKTDFKIHSEFGYYARALTSVMKYHMDEDYGHSFQSSLDDVTGSARYIVNDVLDLLLAYAEISTNENDQICETTAVSQVYSGYDEAMDIIDRIAELTEETRGKRGVERVDDYLNVFRSDDYKKLRAYCVATPRIANDLKIKRKEEVIAGRRFLIQVSITLAIGLTSISILLAVNWDKLFS